MISPIIFAALLITTFTIVHCDLINLDNIWTSTSTFHRDHDYALIGHVVKTLPLFIADCLVACQETLRCFSVNYINFHNGTFSCELNWSNKKQSKDSFVRREGYEYAEPESFLQCEGELCAKKEALEDGWFQFNSSKFKIAYDKMSWSNARAHCKSLGGDLASFGSHTEYQFVQETMLYHNFLISTSLETFSLHGGATIVTKDSRKAIYFDGHDDYATIPTFNIHKTDFTIAFWFKGAGNTYGFFNLLNDKANSVTQFSIFVYYNFIDFKFLNTNAKSVTKGSGIRASDFPIGQWYHMTVTWNRQAKRCKTYLDGVLKKTVISPLANVDLRVTGKSHYEIGGQAGTKMFNGWISQLVGIPQELKQTEVVNLKDGRYFGAWIGLNDIYKEGTLKWSDNKPLTYMHAVQNQDASKDCLYLRKDKGSITTWSFESCSEEYPFICEKL